MMMTTNNLHTKIKSLGVDKQKLLALKLKAALKGKDNNSQKKGKEKAHIVAYVKTSGASSIDNLKGYLKKKLPDYMIPSNVILVEDMPLLPNGKIDRNALSKLKVKQIDHSPSSYKGANNATEQTLIDIWESILKIGRIGIHDNFFEIGGDSILSIQIIAKARKEGIIIKSNQIFEHQTIAELALFVNQEFEKNEEVIYNGSAKLSPIQKWFFENHKEAPHYWNQGLRFDNLSEIKEERIAEITNILLTQHDALRTTFVKKEGAWESIVNKPDQIIAYEYVNINSESDREAQISESLKSIQETISLSKGSLFKCIYFLDTIDNKHSCVLLAHHLIIDYVSWLVIKDQFEDLINDSSKHFIISQTSPYFKWSEKLDDQKDVFFNKEKEYWLEQESTTLNLPLNKENEDVIFEKDIEVSISTIDKNTTQKLIDSTQSIYQVKPDEVIISALVNSLSDWTKQKTIPIFLEKHGREYLDTSIDISNTIGWFTSFFPCSFNYNEDLGKHIIQTKEILRSIPQGGIGYGALKYNSKLLNANYQPSVVFNFLGFQDSKSDSSSYFLEQELRHPLSERAYPIEINASIIDGVLTFKWSYSPILLDKPVIKKLQQRLQEVINKIIDHCSDQEETVFTPSDFPEAELSQDDLNSLLDIL